MYSLPPYIDDAKIADQNLRFLWDDSNTQVAEGQTDAKLVQRLSRLSQRANVAYAIAIAEWVIGRFSMFAGNETALLYVEACWAVAIDLRYCRTVWEDFPHNEPWGGPVKGVIWLAMLRLQQTIGSLVEEGDPEYTASKLHQLIRHVIPDGQFFDAWDRDVLSRLERLFPREDDDLLGEVVPREFLDPATEPSLPDHDALIDRFLQTLDYRANPFLNTPERMREEGFLGIPYRFVRGVG